ncbi:MAG: type II toxin-antitoxin system RelE/ParE family toxin [Planctomycetes bacterium]|nr:type II toxin-antitoxin system RelE/ParE family toxin [Planctomycetota bacterium]
MEKPPKIVRWSVSSRKELQSLPKDLRQLIGHDLWEVQLGKTPLTAKVLHGFGGGDVLEIRANLGGSAFRAVYTVRFGDFVYVLHVFQKKSKKGSKTPPNIIDLIRKRLRKAEEDYESRKEKTDHTD